MKIEDVLPYIRDKSAYTLKEAEELRLLTWDEINKVQDLAEKNKNFETIQLCITCKVLIQKLADNPETYKLKIDRDDAH